MGTSTTEGGTTPALVEAAGDAWTVAPQDVFTFGRSERCSLCLRPYDEGVSRRAGSVQCEARTWRLTNESGTRPFEVVDQIGLSHSVPPGARYAVYEGRVEVILAGLTYRYCIAITVDTPAGPVAPQHPSTGAATVGAQEVLLTPRERLALVALFAGYLESFPWNTNEPVTYKEAADRLKVSPDAVRRRIDHLRQKLTAAGVADLWGPEARRHLAAYVLATRVITVEDLRLLPPR